MQQLSPLDASFLYAETARAPMHVGALSIYDPSTAPNGRVGVDAIVENIRRRAGRIDCFHRRLIEVPFRLDHPYWIGDAGFRPEQHVHRVVLPDPGDRRTLRQLVARLHSRPLRRERPLWEMHVIEGLDRIGDLPKGCYGVFVKLHHAAVDGIAGIGVTLALHDLEPDPAETPPATCKHETPPSTAELLTRAQLRGLTQPLRWLAALPELSKLASRSAPVASAPRTRFGRDVSTERAFGFSRFPFEAVHQIEAAAPGATVNDVVLTVVGGAMHRYLASKEELPERTLLAMSPISVRARGEEGRGGNRLSQMIVPLHSDLTDPLERLVAVHAGTERGKRTARGIDPEAVRRCSELMPASWVSLASSSAAAAAPRFNTVVSDVPGPQASLYSCGAELLQVYGAGPVADGSGLFHTALSYHGALTITTTSCSQMMPDPDFYHACLQTSYEELRAAT